MSDGLKLLGSIIETGSVHTLRELSVELFLDEEVELYDYMRRHYRRYGQIPAIATVEEELGIQIPRIDETAEFYIHRVHDRRLYNQIKDQYNDLKTCLRDYNMEAAKEVIAEMGAATRIARSSNDIRNLGEAMQDVMAEYAYAHANPGLSGVPTGWGHYDMATGGHQPGDLVTLVARPCIGKTYVLLHMARMAWHFGYNVLVVTMEMTIEQITRRIAAMQAGINPDYIRKGTLSTYAYRRLTRCIEGLRGCERFRLFSGGMKKRTSDVELLIQEYRPDIVFVDGVYLMQPESKRPMQKIERVSEVFDSLKQMTLAHNIPAVVTTQFNRQAGKKGKEGSLENIAFTDAISTHSSLVLSLMEGMAPHQSDQRILRFLKGREGEAGEYPINFGFAPVNFGEVVQLRREGEDEEEGGTSRIVQSSEMSLDWMG